MERTPSKIGIIHGENTTEIVYNDNGDSVSLRFMPEVKRNKDFSQKMLKVLEILKN